MSSDLKPLVSFASPLAILGFLTSLIKGLFSGSFSSALVSGLISALAMGFLGVGVFFLLKTIMPELFQANTISGGPVNSGAGGSPSVSSPSGSQNSVDEVMGRVYAPGPALDSRQDRLLPSSAGLRSS